MKIINVMASSLDGCIAKSSKETDKERRDYGFVDNADREFLKSQLEIADAVICGSSSLIASGKIWELLNHRGELPEWYVYTNSGLPDDLIFWDQDKVIRYLVSEKPLELKKNQKKVENFTYSKNDPAKALVDFISQRKGIENVLLFGGGIINQLFYEADLVDELKITICPFVFANMEAAKLVNAPLSKSIQFSLQSSHTIKNHVFLSYTVNKF